METRREVRSEVGRFRGGKLVPVMATPIHGDEAGTINQSIMIELDPIPGRLLTPITAEFTMVYVPVQAIDAIKDPDGEFAGVTELIRNKLLEGTPLFATEVEGEISKRCGVIPRPVSGVKRVSEAVRLAHNAAVNYLRKRRYAYAVEVLHSNTAITPAILAQTVLDRLNGVLDPDDRINGQVNLSLPGQNMKVSGISFTGTPTASGAATQRDADGTNYTFEARPQTSSAGITVKATAGSLASARPDVYAIFDGAVDGLSLSDLYNAEKQDRLARAMRAIIDGNPVDGEEQVLRWAYGMTMEPGRNPWIVAERSAVFGQQYREATDGNSLLDDVAMSKMMVKIDVTAVIPRSELGGIIITFCSVKPDETLALQPHPILSDNWVMPNRVADQLKIDPVPVTFREVDASVGAGAETTVAFYTGYNALKRMYVNYGLNRHMNPADIENRSAIWQVAVPPSVTPENILYPADLDHYPFADNTAEVARYMVNSAASIMTPFVFGPTPVEDVAIIDGEDLFDEEETP